MGVDVAGADWHPARMKIRIQAVFFRKSMPGLYSLGILDRSEGPGASNYGDPVFVMQ